MVEHMCGMGKTQGSIPNTTNQKRQDLDKSEAQDVASEGSSLGALGLQPLLRAWAISFIAYCFCQESFLPLITASYQGHREVRPHQSATREDGSRSSLGKKDHCCQPLRGDSSS